MSDIEINYETTEQHFKWYKEFVNKWAKFHGLMGWKFWFEHVDECESDEGLEGYAAVNFCMTGRAAVFKLNRNWGDEKPNREKIKASAYHEILELMLGRLRILSTMRSIEEREVTEEIHSIIRTMENIYLPIIKI